MPDKPKHTLNWGIALACGFVIFVAVTTVTCDTSLLDLIR